MGCVSATTLLIASLGNNHFVMKTISYCSHYFGHTNGFNGFGTLSELFSSSFSQSDYVTTVNFHLAIFPSSSSLLNFLHFETKTGSV